MQVPTGDDYRVLQIHATTRCYKTCPLCNSADAEEKEELSSDLLRQTLSDALVEGYNAVAISGCEPLMFSSLNRVLAHAQSLGMAVTLTTDGLLLDNERLQELRPLVDLILISLDGVEESHNRVRGNPRAFELMKRRLEDVRNSDIEFGFVFTLTTQNLKELQAVARFAAEQRASLLKVHPLEEVGHRHSRFAGSSPDDLELAYAFDECARIKEMYSGKLQLQFDVANRQVLRDHPCKVYADEPADRSNLSKRLLADLVPTLVVESDGFVVPIQQGFSRAYGLGSLKDNSFRNLAATWKVYSYHSFNQLCRRVFHQLVDIDRSDLPFTNWHGMIMHCSYGHPLSRNQQLTT